MQFLGTFPLYLRDHYGLLENRIGMLYAVNTIAIVLFEMVLIKFVEKRDPLKLCAIRTLFLCFGSSLMPLGQTFGFAVFTVVVWTFGEMLSAPMLHAVAGQWSPVGAQGKYMAAIAMSFSVAFVIAGPLGTSVYEKIGPHFLWYSVGVLGLGLSYGYWLLSPKFKKPLELKGHTTESD